jgi:hypothetical protein
MDSLTFIAGLIETQGLVAVMLAWMIIQSSRERKALLHKNCELNRFLMDCLKHALKYDEDHTCGSNDISKEEPVQ